MGLLNFSNSNQQQSGGLLGDLAPDERAMVAMALINKFASNNRGSESGFGDIFNMMAQQEQMKRQAMMDQMQLAKFNMDYTATQQKAAQEAEKQGTLNKMAQGIIDYKAPPSEMKPVIAEYNNVPLMGGDSLKIPTTNYLNNMFSASDEARNNPQKGVFINDPQARAIAAELVKTGEASNIQEALKILTNGGAYTLSPGQVRRTGTGEVIGDNPYKPQLGQPQSVIGPDGKFKLVQFDNQGGAQEVKDYSPIPKGGMTVRDANGNVIFEQGGWGQSTSPTNATQNDLQKDTISASDTLMRLDAIANEYKSSYLTYGGEARAWGASKLGKIFGQSGDKQFLQGRTKFRTGVQQMFNQYRKEITGAAASVQELDRLKQSMLNEDMSPEEFEAAYGQFRNIVSNSLALKQKYLRQGVPVDQIGKMIDQNVFDNQSNATENQSPQSPSNNKSQYTPEQLDQMANEAIKQGRDPNAVQQMLKQMRGY